MIAFAGTPTRTLPGTGASLTTTAPAPITQPLAMETPPQDLCTYADVNAVSNEGAVIGNTVVSYAVVAMKLDALSEHGGGVDHNGTVVDQIDALTNVITRHLESKFVTK